jgi:hypothetical protein
MDINNALIARHDLANDLRELYGLPQLCILDLFIIKESAYLILSLL